MIKTDYHMHSNFSTDSPVAPEEIVERAISLNLREICITDHYDPIFPGKPGEYIFDPDAYFKKWNELKEENKDKLSIKIGMELGLRNEKEIVDEVTELGNHLATYPFDFIIGSTHIIEYDDPYFPSFWENKNPDDVIRAYLEANLFNATHYDTYDVYGHLDYVTRYMPKDYDYDINRFMELYEAHLKVLIDKGKGIEINSAALYKGFGHPNPDLPILKLYKELGGEIITIGSDAHRSERITLAFDEAKKYLEAAGFKRYCLFTNRKPEYIDL